jgi:hypothetical protein
MCAYGRSVVDVRLATNQAKNANAATVTSCYFWVVRSSVISDFLTYTLKAATASHLNAYACIIVKYGHKLPAHI